MEAQARAPRVLRAAAQFAATNAPAGAAADPPAAHGTAGVDQTWALDFMTESLYDSRRVRLLTIIDEGNRERLEIAMGLSLPSRRVVRVLNELVAIHGRPSAVRVDNRPEFTAQPFVDWCAEHGVATHDIQPGKPDQNAYIQRFNRSYRTEVLNAQLIESIAKLRASSTLAPQLQRRAAPRQPRAGAAADVSPEAFISGLLSKCPLDGGAYASALGTS